MTGWCRSAASSSTANGCSISTSIRGELAESYDVSPDGLKLTFRLRKDAKFQDGSPVTAEDVKWSLDRCVTAPILGKAQLLTGSLTSADQFKVIDPLTIEVTLPKPDKLALPNLATVYPLIINSKVAKEHATAGGSVGHRLAEGAYRRQRCLCDRDASSPASRSSSSATRTGTAARPTSRPSSSA